MNISKGRAAVFMAALVMVAGVTYMVSSSRIRFEIDKTLLKNAPQPQIQADTEAPLAVLPSTTPIVRRFAPDTGWTRVWSVGSDTTTDLLIEPRHVTVSGDVVAVLDDGTREVRAFDRRTGAPRFVLMPRGQGPGEFKRPTVLASTPTGFAVLDGENSRLTAYDRKGMMEWDIVLDDFSTIGGLCIRRGPSISVFHQRAENSVVDYDTTGRRTAVRSYAWSEPQARTAAFAFTSFVSNVSDTGSCILAPLFNSHWIKVLPEGPLQSYWYKEPGGAPVLATQESLLGRSGTKVAIQTTTSSDSPQAARGALIVGDTAIIAAAHTKQFRYRILDYHKLSTGEYLYSRLTPLIFNSLAIGADGTFYVTYIDEQRQALIALKPGKNQ